MKRNLATTFIALTIATFAFTSAPALAGGSSKAKAELRNIMKIHNWDGRRITPAIREAAGDRTMAVFDYRMERFSPAQCTYITYRGKRAITCDSI